MYQSIDEPNEGEEPQKRNFVPIMAWGVATLALLAVLTATYTFKSEEAAQIAEGPVNSETRQTYLKAIGEVDAAMRRARLQDFQKTYPKSGRSKVIQAQLDVINLRDSEAWNEVQSLYYDDRTEPEAKIAALDRYNSEWGGGLLGGRGEEIEALRKAIENQPGEDDIETQTPSRKLEGVKSPISTAIRDDDLLGGPRRAVTFVPPAEPTPTPQPPSVTVYKPQIVEAKIRKDVKPKYPSRAWRKKIPGIVTLRLDIDKSGDVVSTELVSVQAERYEKNFVKVSERAAMKSRYFPKTVDGKPVAVKGLIKRYRFARE